MILEDDDASTSSFEAAATGSDSTTELNNLTDLPNQDAWYDIEYGRHVVEDRPSLPLEQDELTRMAAQGVCPSPELLRDMTNQCKDGNTQYTSEELGLDMLYQQSDNDGEPEGGKSVSELEKDIVLAFKEQDELSSAHSPNSVHLHHLSPKPVQPDIGQEPDQSRSSSTGLEELSYGSPLQSQSQEETERSAAPLKQQLHEKVADEAKEIENGSCWSK